GSLLRMRKDSNDGVLIAVNLEVKPPASVPTSLPEIVKAFQLILAHRGVARICQKELKLFPKCFADIRRKRGVIPIGSIGETNLHRRLARFFARVSRASIASLADSYGPCVLPLLRSSSPSAKWRSSTVFGENVILP